MEKRNELSVAIIVAAVLVSGALVFAGFKMSNPSQDAIFKGIDAYVEMKQAEAQKAQAEANKPRFVQGDFSGESAIAGDISAPITIVEFSDFQCPYCAKFYENAYKELKSKYISTGKVKLYFRHLPLSFHPGAMPAAIATECVREQKGDSGFYSMHDKIFANQGIFSGDLNTINTNIKTVAKSVGVDMTKFNDCYDNQKTKSKVDADQAAAASVGIDGTPGFIVNGQIISGAQPFAVFQAAIEAKR